MKKRRLAEKAAASASDTSKVKAGELNRTATSDETFEPVEPLTPSSSVFSNLSSEEEESVRTDRTTESKKSDSENNNRVGLEKGMQTFYRREN